MLGRAPSINKNFLTTSSEPLKRVAENTEISARRLFDSCFVARIVRAHHYKFLIYIIFENILCFKRDDAMISRSSYLKTSVLSFEIQLFLSEILQ